MLSVDTLFENLKNLLTRRIISYLAALFAIFLTSGGVYLFIYMPGALASTGSGTSFISRSSMSMTSSEFFVAFFLTVAGMAGFLLLQRALQKSFNISSSKMTFLMAVSLIILSLVLLEYVAYAKFY